MGSKNILCLTGAALEMMKILLTQTPKASVKIVTCVSYLLAPHESISPCPFAFRRLWSWGCAKSSILKPATSNEFCDLR